MTAPYIPQMARYRRWLEEQRGFTFADYEQMRQWSVREIDAFWQSIWDYFDLQSPTPHSAVLAQRRMPGAVWFPGAQVNYARQVLRHVEAADAAGMPAIVSSGEDGVLKETSWPELRRKVGCARDPSEGTRRPFRRSRRGLPSEYPRDDHCLSRHRQHRRDLERLRSRYGGASRDRPVQADRAKSSDRMRRRDLCRAKARGAGEVIEELRRSLPTVAHVIIHSDTPERAPASDALLSTILSATGAEIDAFEPAWLPFDHPLWIVYSSGTTGLPKPIVHGHGGIIIVALPLNGCTTISAAATSPNSFGERYHWYSSTGWIMWNCQVDGLLNGTTMLHLRRQPGRHRRTIRTGPRCGVSSPKLRRTFFGAGAAFFASCHQGRDRSCRRRRPVETARARLDGVAALRRHPAMVQRALRPPR